VVDVGVAGDQDDVARIPPELVHFGTGHREKRRDGSAAGALRDAREKVYWGVHWPVLYRKTIFGSPSGPKNGLLIKELQLRYPYWTAYCRAGAGRPRRSGGSH
jgi:hypothetical protein